MKETIVAQRPLAPAIIGLAAVAALFLGVASTVSFFRAVLLLAFGAYWGWKLFHRIARMRLAVTDEKVIVVNLDECVELDLKTVDVDSRNTRYRWPVRWVVEKVSSAFSDDGSSNGRVLWLTDANGRSASVDVAPSYGSGLDTVAEDLIVAIEQRRAAA